MRYDYECGSCGQVFEHTCSMSERPDVLPCQCGGEAPQVIISVPTAFMRFRELKLDQTRNVPSFGRAFGRTDDQQLEGYRKTIEHQRKVVHEANRSMSSKDKEFEFVGCAPMEAVLSFNENEGNKEAAQLDPVGLYKRLGTYMGRE